MRVIRVGRFGGPDVLETIENLPDPEPGRNELVVDVVAIGVSWLDTRIRAGEGPDVFAVTPPFVPGSAVAGTVRAIGPAVDGDLLGASVVTHAIGGYGGGYADTVLAAADATFPLPPGLDPHTAVAVIDDGSTALALLETTPVGPGDVVLVAPGMGGLGSLLVQLAVAAGGRVIAAVRGAEKAAAARVLGADVADYAVRDFAEEVLLATGGRRLDVVFDGIGGAVGAVCSALVADGGKFSGYGMTSGAEAVVDDATRQRLTTADMSQLPGFWPDTPRRVRHVLAEAAAGRLNPVIGQTYELADAAVAHADIEARRVVGKSVLVP
ncbi:zinc-binding dehydrogenase [Nocardia caishijiensis]|uniref:NADPH:quinone reductase-like Zn-dependent oxidoreductase n=1 Tax=Nocardia caishijiensis TaxID=184756 RepID=A0ABQ6YG98_9NOCA|nr:zinc-binding dehydrogenase [Nocardia caishijiensis]KAF0844822.1 NADPH:quinone reductase-like Zn-dependent oxidoreductase [Nocardia caishijiensis]